MAIDFKLLGKRISSFRNKADLSQTDLAEKVMLSREHISLIERAERAPSIDTIVDIANVLGVSVDDLLVDSLEHSTSTADSEIHRLLLDCNETEEKILTRTVEELKAILYGLGI